MPSAALSPSRSDTVHRWCSLWTLTAGLTEATWSEIPQGPCSLITEGNLCPVLVSLTNKHTHTKSINTHDACIPRDKAAGILAQMIFMLTTLLVYVLLVLLKRLFNLYNMGKFYQL